MSWLSELAGKAESLLNNLDEQTGVALRNHNAGKKKQNELFVNEQSIADKRKRIIQRNVKKSPPKRSSSPVSQTPITIRQPRANIRDTSDQKNVRSRKSPSPAKTNSVDKNDLSHKSDKRYTLNHPPQTLVGGVSDEEVEITCVQKKRRNSLPVDFTIISNDNENWLYRMQNLEIENVMLKNEVNVMNKEFMELLYRLRKTEDGNDVDYEELKSADSKLESVELLNKTVDIENLLSEMQELKMKLPKLVHDEIMVYKDKNRKLIEEIETLRNRNQDLEHSYQVLQEQLNEKQLIQVKLENDSRHAQSSIVELQSNLQKTTDECRRLEKDWEAYKLRVKNMLHAKDSKIKSLQEGLNFTEETKDLMKNIESLKEERDELSNAVIVVREQCEQMQASLRKMESQNTAAERMVGALRDALREERAARNKAEAQCLDAMKELKSLQVESSQTILNLHTTLREKEEELHRLQDTTLARTTDTSALNVADYDVAQDTIDNNKIKCLTETLVQKQARIDKLLAHNNTLRIQLDKLETKLKSEIAGQVGRSKNLQSVVHLHEGDHRHRPRHYMTDDTLSTLSVRLGVMIKRYPFVRLFVIFYMVCLHIWVLTVLLTSTPEDYMKRPTKS